MIKVDVMNKSEAGKLGWLKTKDVIARRTKERLANRINEYYRSPTLCAYCNETMSYDKRDNKYCSSECSSKSRIKHGRYVLDYSGDPIKARCLSSVKCIYCDKEITSKDTRRKYCDTICQANYQNDSYINKWKSGEISGATGYQTSKRIRNYFLKKYDNKCSMCGWGQINPYTGKVPLELEHIDGNYANNVEDNLVILCPNCHSMTSTYKGANRGSGRKGRGKYKLDRYCTNISMVEALTCNEVVASSSLA